MKVMLPHKIPKSVLKAEGDVISWQCDACGQWVGEYPRRKRTSCKVDWRNGKKKGKNK